MLIYEYRIPLPITVEEYRTGLLWSTAEMSKNITGGREGVELVKNEPFENALFGTEEIRKGQHTMKIFFIQSLVPAIIRKLARPGELDVMELAWNCYPYCKTLITNDYMRGNFTIDITSLYKSDLGESENVHNLSEEDLAQRKVINFDITDRIRDNDYQEETDPTKVDSGRGPLASDWLNKLSSEVANGNKDVPYMCVYKLVKYEFKWHGLQQIEEARMHKHAMRTIPVFYRSVFCWMKNWRGLTMEDIRKYEAKTYEALEKTRKLGDSWFQ